MFGFAYPGSTAFAGFQSGAAPSPSVTIVSGGKYKPEHDSALADLGAAGLGLLLGFLVEHAGVLKDLSDAGV